MVAKVERLSDLRARIGWVILAAPDRFPTVGAFGVDQCRNLLIAFEILQGALPLVEKKIKNPAELERLKQLLSDSLMAYQHGEKKKGANLLQNFQNTLFPNRFKEYEERKGMQTS
jgi:hypothetical protein